MIEFDFEENCIWVTIQIEFGGQIERFAITSEFVQAHSNFSHAAHLFDKSENLAEDLGFSNWKELAEAVEGFAC